MSFRLGSIVKTGYRAGYSGQGSREQVRVCRLWSALGAVYGSDWSEKVTLGQTETDSAPRPACCPHTRSGAERCCTVGRGCTETVQLCTRHKRQQPTAFFSAHTREGSWDWYDCDDGMYSSNWVYRFCSNYCDSERKCKKKIQSSFWRNVMLDTQLEFW